MAIQDWRDRLGDSTESEVGEQAAWYASGEASKWSVTIRVRAEEMRLWSSEEGGTSDG